MIIVHLNEYYSKGEYQSALAEVPESGTSKSDVS